MYSDHITQLIYIIFMRIEEIQINDEVYVCYPLKPRRKKLTLHKFYRQSEYSNSSFPMSLPNRSQCL